MPFSPIHIEVHFTPTELDELQLRGKNVVVIDVLRAATTICVALQNGAKEIIPVSSIESAVKISSSLFGDVTIRAGERNGKMIEGFNLGNSPLEFTEEAVKGKSIIFLTTNGSVAMVKSRYAKNLFIVSFVNLSSVVEALKELTEDFILVCSGQDNHFCLEDAVCAGKIINHLKKILKKEFCLDDAASAAASLDTTYGKNILRTLKQCEHGKDLAKLGFAEDLKVCSDIDSVPLVPVLSGNVIRMSKNPFQSKRNLSNA
jgi:2-phosphosulfolactate phosphatase